MALNRRRFIHRVRRLAARCDPNTPERKFAVRMYCWLRSRLTGLPASMVADPELVARPRPDQDYADAEVTSLAQAKNVFNAIFNDAMSE